MKLKFNEIVMANGEVYTDAYADLPPEFFDGFADLKFEGEPVERKVCVNPKYIMSFSAEQGELPHRDLNIIK